MMPHDVNQRFDSSTDLKKTNEHFRALLRMRHFRDTVPLKVLISPLLTIESSVAQWLEGCFVFFAGKLNWECYGDLPYSLSQPYFRLLTTSDSFFRQTYLMALPSCIAVSPAHLEAL